MKKSTIALFLVLFPLTACSQAQTNGIPPAPEGLAYYDDIMGAPPLLPANAEPGWQQCAPAVAADSQTYRTSQEVGTDEGWIEATAHDWQALPMNAEDGKITVIDFAQKDGQMAYRYLANANTHDDLYEPWSSSKIMAFAGVMSLLSDNFAQPDTLIGDVKLADLITSINSYEASGKADGNSNALAYYLVNLAGRDYLTALFHDAWLRIGQPQVMFRGAYGPDAFQPTDLYWRTPSRQVEAQIVSRESDSGSRSYRCDDCGLTGNKPMTTLASAEFLKRLAAHKRDRLTQMPGLSDDAVQMLFYGLGHSENSANAGGMMAGASLTPHRAIAAALQHEFPELQGLSVQQTLDQATNGNWRIFHKLGAGPSETRGASEVVALAHICLPLATGTKEFTFAAQASVDDNSYDHVGVAGAKLERLIENAVRELIQP